MTDQDKARAMKLLRRAFDPANQPEAELAASRLRDLLNASGSKVDDLLPALVPRPQPQPTPRPQVVRMCRPAPPPQPVIDIERAVFNAVQQILEVGIGELTLRTTRAFRGGRR